MHMFTINARTPQAPPPTPNKISRTAPVNKDSKMNRLTEREIKAAGGKI